MKIIWFSWKDVKNPLAGGAEVVGNELCKRLVEDGHEVVFLTARYKKVKSQKPIKSKKEEIIDGYKVIRVGNRFTVYWETYKYYKKNLQGWADVVIDEINTIPFFAKFYIKNEDIKVFLFVHQLCREIWFYQMFLPFNVIGYLLEPVYLWVLRRSEVITVSNSTKKDLEKYGFRKKNINIISEGINIEPLKKLESIDEIKYEKPTILSLGTVRAMKRTRDIVEAFEIAKETMPELQLIVAGNASDKYGKKTLEYVKQSKYTKDIKIYGHVDLVKKKELMQKSHLIAVTSVKEGWGLIVTEANSQGTPAVVYDVDGLRDSVKHNKTGFVCNENNPNNLSENMVNLLRNRNEYSKLRKLAWNWSKEITFEKSYRDFVKNIFLKV